MSLLQLRQILVVSLSISHSVVWHSPRQFFRQNSRFTTQKPVSVNHPIHGVLPEPSFVSLITSRANPLGSRQSLHNTLLSRQMGIWRSDTTIGHSDDDRYSHSRESTRLGDWCDPRGGWSGGDWSRKIGRYGRVAGSSVWQYCTLTTVTKTFWGYERSVPFGLRYAFVISIAWKSSLTVVNVQYWWKSWSDFCWICGTWPADCSRTKIWQVIFHPFQHARNGITPGNCRFSPLRNSNVRGPTIACVSG
jgi:hypothetical protein